MSRTLALLHAFFVVKQCNGKTFFVFLLRVAIQLCDYRATFCCSVLSGVENKFFTPDLQALKSLQHLQCF